MKVVVCGVICSGKVNVAEEYGNVIKTDDFMFLDWSEQSEFLLNLFDLEKSSFTLEGVTAIRALRKWINNNDGKPCDKLIFLDRSFVELETTGQKAMCKGIQTIFDEIEEELIKRDVEIIKNPEVPKDG